MEEGSRMSEQWPVGPDERLVFSVDYLDDETVAELVRTAPHGVKVMPVKLTAFSPGADSWPGVMVYTAGLISAEAVKVITRWIMDGTRSRFFRKKVESGADSSVRITINHRQVDYDEGSVRRVVEEQIEISRGEK